jgi:DNA-binding response OmpR family regulator
VDDDPGMRELITTILATEDVTACSAVDGKDAVLKTITEEPDLVLLDVRMPNLNGLTVCKAIRAGADTRNIPIIMITGLTATGHIEECMEAGADDFLGKPFQAKELLIRVRAMFKTAHVSDRVERLEQYILALHEMHTHASAV